MTKEDFLKYIREAVEAMDEQDMNQLFPHSKQPDLYTLLEALTGLRGEVKKVAQSSLLLQNEVQMMVEKLQESTKIEAKKTKPSTIIDTPTKEEKRSEKDLRYNLRELIKMEAIIQKTVKGLENLPELRLLSINEFNKQFAAWKAGFLLFNKQWNVLLKSTGMYQTGKIDTLFNPELHEAVATNYDPTKSENTILESEQIGYLYKEKVIQQAKVVVNREKEKS